MADNESMNNISDSECTKMWYRKWQTAVSEWMDNGWLWTSLQTLVEIPLSHHEKWMTSQQR